MAKLTLRGTVSRINPDESWFGLRESWQTRDGVDKFRYWSVWPHPDEPRPALAVGDEINVTGRLEVRVSLRDPRYVDCGVMNGRIRVIAAVGAVVDVTTATHAP